METVVMEAKQCPKCGRLLPGGALAGLCPACLLAQGAETDAGEGRAAPFQPPPIGEVAQTLTDPAQVSDELRSLQAALAG
jgi:hypothetical protein